MAPARDAPPSGERRPDVILDVVFEQGLLFLLLRNIRFDRPLSGVEGTKEISALPVFRRLSFLGPGREIRVFLDSSASYFSRRQPTRLAVEIGYRDRDGRKYETTIKHDLSVYRELGYVSPALDTERR
jgi:hypothetical protein